MKRFFLWPVIVFLLLGFFLKITKAVSIYQPFGGKVVTNFIAGVTCPGTGPITIRPSNLAPAGPYTTTPTTKKYGFRPITINSWVIGFYLPATTPICFTDSVPPIAIPVFPIVSFGASWPDFLSR